MKNQTLIEKLNEIAKVDNTWQEDVAYYEKNTLHIIMAFL